MNVPTAPPPAMTTFIGTPPSARWRSTSSVWPTADRQVHHVAVLGDEVGGGDLGDAHAADGHGAGHAGDVDVGERTTGPARGHRALDHATWALGSTQSSLGGVGHELAQHPVDRPLHGGDGGDAEALVDDGPAGVVDAGHDPSTPKVSRATRAVRMLELSPLVTAAIAAASRMPACSSRSRSKPTPTTCWPPKPSCRRRNAFGSLSTTATEWPLSSMIRARPEPTRPQPTMTTCMRGDATCTPWPGRELQTCG